MSKCELLPKGCDCGSTEAAKCQQSEKPKMPKVGQSEQFYCKKETCNEEEQCNHCWNIENPPNVFQQ